MTTTRGSWRTLSGAELGRAIDVWRLGPLLSEPLDYKLIKYGLLGTSSGCMQDFQDEAKGRDSHLKFYLEKLSREGRCSVWAVGRFKQKFFNKDGGVHKRWLYKVRDFAEHCGKLQTPVNVGKILASHGYRVPAVYGGENDVEVRHKGVSEVPGSGFVGGPVPFAGGEDAVHPDAENITGLHIFDGN